MQSVFRNSNARNRDMNENMSDALKAIVFIVIEIQILPFEVR